MKPTESTVLVGLPIVGTALAYLFEAGFAQFHGIPTSLIQLSVSQFVGTAVIGLICLWALHMYFALGVALLARRKSLAFKFIGLGMLYSALPALLVLGLSAESRLWYIIAVFFVLPSAIGFFAAVVARDRSTPFFQRWWNMTAKDLEEPETPPDRLTPLIEAPQALFAASLVVIFLAFTLGHRYASAATPQTVLASDPTKVLIVTYGSRWFFRPLAEVGIPRSVSSGELHIVEGDSVKSVVLRRPPRPASAASGA